MLIDAGEFTNYYSNAYIFKLTLSNLNYFLAFIFFYNPILFVIWRHREQYQNLLTYEDEVSVVLVFAGLNTIFLLLLSLLRRERALRALTSILLSFAILPLCFPLSQFGDLYIRLVEEQRYECPRDNGKVGGFDFSFSDENLANQGTSLGEKNQNIIESPPCIGRYKDEPFLSYFARRIQIGFLQIQYNIKNLDVAQYLAAQIFKLDAAIKNLWKVKIQEKATRPNIYLLYENDFDLAEIKQALHYMYRKGDVVQPILLEENLHFKKISRNCNEVGPSDSQSLEFIPFHVLDNNCRELAINKKISDCYEDLKRGTAVDCSLKKIIADASEGTYLKNRSYYCDNDSLKRNTVIVCISNTAADNEVQTFRRDKREYQFQILHAEKNSRDIILAFKDMLAGKFRSISAVNPPLDETSTILDEYDSYIRPKEGQIEREQHSYILEYRELQQIRKDFLQRHSGILNEK